MKLTSIPADFSPILADNYFHFEEVDPAVSTEIYFFDSDGQRLGARRYAGRSVIDSSPRAIIRRMLDPQPVVRGPLRLEQPARRQVALSVAVGEDGERSALVRFGANVVALEPSAMVGPARQRRVISPDEFDELSLYLKEGDGVIVDVTTPQSDTSERLLRYVCPSSGLYTLTYSFEDLRSALDQQEESVELELRVWVGGLLKGVIDYLVVPSAKGDCRVAWLDAYGAVRHYTFRSQPEEHQQVERRESDTLSGTHTLAVESWSRLRLRSGLLSRGEMDFVRGLTSAPRLWRLEGDEWRPCTIEESVCRCSGEGAMSIDVTLRPSRKSQLW